MQPKEIQIPDKLKPLVNPHIETALSIVRSEKQVAPIAILHSTESNSVHHIMLDFSCDESKEKCFDVVKKMSREIKADLSIFITEAHMRRIAEDESVDDVYEKNGGRLSNDAKSVDCLVVSIETPAELFLGTALITDDSSTKSGRTCNSPTFVESRLEGRMVGFIERQVMQ